MAVKALISPPTASIAAEMSSARRARGALEQQVLEEVRGSRPAAGVSSREPTPTQTPSVAERTPGTASVTTRSPPGRTVRRTTPAADLVERRAAGSARRGRGGCVAPAPAQRVSASLDPPVRRRSASAGSAVRGVLDDRDQRRACRGRRSRRSRPGSCRRRDDVLDVLDPLAARRSLEMCSRPSLPGSSETNAPKVVVFTTVPR